MTLQFIYENYLDDPEKIQEYVNNIEIQKDLQELQNILINENIDKTKTVFYVEILSKSIKKQEDLLTFYKLLISFISNFFSSQKPKIYKNSIFLLRIIKNISNKRIFIPLNYYLSVILREAIDKKCTRSNKKYTEDNIRLSSDDLKNEELQMFVIAEGIKLIKNECKNYSDNPGFPELAKVICNELRKSKIGVYKELIGSVINEINNMNDFKNRK